MNTSIRKEFAKLVFDVRQFIQKDMRPVSQQNTMNPSAPTSLVHPPPLQKEPLETAKLLPPVLPPPIIPTKPTTYTPVIKGNWELQAMPSVEDPAHLRQKLAVYTTIQAPPLRVLLILPEDNNPHRLFLENVSRAVTRTFGSAKVALYQDGILDQIQGKLVLAPLSLFQKKFPKAQIHIPLQDVDMTWIPLENLDIYAHDVTAKRALWMSIQRSFQS